MKRFYLFSTIIHLLLFLWLYSTEYFGLASKDESAQDQKEITEKLKIEEESNFEELIKKQIEESVLPGRCTSRKRTKGAIIGVELNVRCVRTRTEAIDA